MNVSSGLFTIRIAQAVFAGVCLLLSLACPAQGIVDCIIQGRVRTPLVRGTVVDPTGDPVPGTLVVLEANGEKLQQIRTGADGNFNLRVPSGTYQFKVMHPQFTGVAVDLVVGSEFTDIVGHSNLYAILGLPGSFCPMVWRSANKFHRMIEANKRSIEEATRQNATQK